MAYIKYKEVTKYFNFSKYVESDVLPDYVLDYIFDDEKCLVAYKTTRDYGVFTDKKIVLFDNTNLFNLKKSITVIPYESISSSTINFKLSSANISLFLNSGYPLVLKFVNLTSKDKVRLRILYSCIIRYMNHQKDDPKEVEKLINNEIKVGN